MTPLFESEFRPAGAPPPSLRVLCETRRRELTELLETLGAGASRTKLHDIGVALDSLQGLLTGDLDRIPQEVAEQLTKWVGSSKYLGASELRAALVEKGAP